MSLVVAIKQNDVVYLGADTQTTTLDFMEKYKKNEENFKITKMPNGVVIGHTGAVISTQQLCSQKNWFEHLPDEGLTKKFIVKKIIPKLYNKYLNKGLLDDYNSVNASFILAWKDKLFYILSNFQVFELEDMAVIGSGKPFALYSLIQNMTVEEKIIKCLSDANKSCTTVGDPFILIDTKKLEYKIVGDEI